MTQILFHLHGLSDVLLTLLANSRTWIPSTSLRRNSIFTLVLRYKQLNKAIHYPPENACTTSPTRWISKRETSDSFSLFAEESIYNIIIASAIRGKNVDHRKTLSQKVTDDSARGWRTTQRQDLTVMASKEQCCWSGRKVGGWMGGATLRANTIR